MGLKYLWDTNTVIYYLQQQFPPDAEQFIDGTLKEFRPAISVITEIELLCWKAPNESDLLVIHNFIEEAFVFELEPTIKRKTAEIRRAFKIKLPDAVIAATALIHNLTLITRNERDFKKIKQLSVVNP